MSPLRISRMLINQTYPSTFAPRHQSDIHDGLVEIMDSAQVGLDPWRPITGCLRQFAGRDLGARYRGARARF